MGAALLCLLVCAVLGMSTSVRILPQDEFENTSGCRFVQNCKAPLSNLPLEMNQSSLGRYCGQVPDVTECIERALRYCTNPVTRYYEELYVDEKNYMCTYNGRQLLMTSSGSVCWWDGQLRLQFRNARSSCRHAYDTSTAVCPFVSVLRRCISNAAFAICGERYRDYILAIFDNETTNRFVIRRGCPQPS